MSFCRWLTLSLALFWAVPPAQAASAQYLGSFGWRFSHDEFGGFSGLELSPDGASFTALSDRGAVFWGRIDRNQGGLMTQVEVLGHDRLRDSKGKILPIGGLKGDPEGLAIDRSGRLFVSFEGLHRVARYDSPDAAAVLLPKPDIFSTFQPNSGLEALAIDGDGALWTLPERSGRLDRPFPLLRFKKGVWSQKGTIPRDGRWLPVGADIGPDGRLYLLERDFWGVLGFLTRVRRFDLDQNGAHGGEVLIETGASRHDNLEGIAVWRDAEGLRLTMISDDNFFWAQRTEFVEYRIIE